MRWIPCVLLVICACSNVSQQEQPPPSGEVREPQSQTVSVYRVCESAAPGELLALPREVPGDVEPATAAVGELLRGVTEEERGRGCRSFFSPETAGALNEVHYSTSGDTIHVDFRDFSDAIADVPQARSFLPPGVMAELTWTIFRQFPDLLAVRFSFDGDERAFWAWAGDGAEPQVFTREMWERV